MAIYHHCLRCKEQRQMKDIVLRIYKNARLGLLGSCAECGRGMSRMLPKLAPTTEKTS